MFIRKRRILQFLKRLFSTETNQENQTLTDFFSITRSFKKKPEIKHLILVWPFIHIPGQTRSSVMIEDVDIFPDNKSMFSFQSFHETPQQSNNEKLSIDNNMIENKIDDNKNNQNETQSKSLSNFNENNENNNKIKKSNSNISALTTATGIGTINENETKGKVKGNENKLPSSVSIPLSNESNQINRQPSQTSSITEKNKKIISSQPTTINMSKQKSNSSLSQSLSLSTIEIKKSPSQDNFKDGSNVCENQSLDLSNPFEEKDTILEGNENLKNLISTDEEKIDNKVEEHKADSSSEESDDSSDDDDDSSDDDDDDSDDSSDDDSSSDESDEEEQKEKEKSSPTNIKKNKLSTIKESDDNDIHTSELKGNNTKPKKKKIQSTSSPKGGGNNNNSNNSNNNQIESNKKSSNQNENIFSRFLGSFLYSNKPLKIDNLSNLAKKKKKKVNIFSRFFSSKDKNTAGVSFQDDIFDTEPDDKKNKNRYRGRKKGKSLQLPKIIYTEPIEGKEFQEKVRRLATNEANLVSRFEFLGIPVAEESRVYTSKGYTVEDMKAIGDTPAWLLQHDQINDNDNNNNNNNNLPNIGKTPLINIPFDSESKENDTTMISDGRYGPRYEGLDMTLPINYPITAGMAKEALENNLKKDKKAKEKIAKTRVPSVSEVLYKKELKENKKWIKPPKWYIQRQKRKEKASQIEFEVGINIMLSSGYPATRRQSLTILPGMTPHYPNPSYETPAVYPDGYTKKNESKSIISSFFSKKKKNSLNVTVSEPVGRKSLEYSSQYQLFQNKIKEEEEARLNKEEEEKQMLKELEEANQVQVPLSIIENQSNNVNNINNLNNLNNEDNQSKNNQEITSLNQSKQSSQIIGTQKTNISNIKENDIDDITIKSKYTNKTKDNTKKSNLSAAGDIISIDGLIQENNDKQLDTKLSNTSSITMQTKGYPEMKKESLELASFTKEKLERSNIKTLLGSKSTKKIYYDRRGSYLVAPGLENFSKYLEEKNDPLKKIQYDEYGRPLSAVGKNRTGSGSKSFIEDNEDTSKDENTLTPRKQIKAAGLVRVMNTNGFDIAHQGTIFDATFSPSENRIASCGGDGLIKIWDPRDGSFVRTLVGHTSEVTSIAYSSNELYLVSGGGDQTILVWDMTTFEVTRKLRGHADVINGIATSHDFSFVVSCSYDNLIKTWFLTPRNPDAPLAPKIITTTQTTVMISWQAPPSFNEPITAFEIQYKIPGQDDWGPNPAITTPPHYRQKTIKDLSPATTYQFRLRATNKMGISEWGAISKYVTTKLGTPLKLPRPEVCDLTSTSITLFFFVPNPKIYGAAPTTLILNKSGEGKDWDDVFYKFTLEESAKRGEELIESFTYWSSEEGKKKRRKLNRSKSKKAHDSHGLDVPLVLMTQTLETSLSVDTILACVEIKNLTPGLMYRFRLAGINAEGQGVWSEPSYSQSTLPDLPDVPQPPTIYERDLTWIKFRWYPPHDNGSAIVGYRVFVKHLNYQFDLPRWENTYRITHLTPGEHYFIKVLAKNAVGWSDYSEYNSIEESLTATAPPDTPLNVQAIDAEWGTMTLKSVIPYDNGMKIHQFHVQYRVVQAFNKGIWSNDITYLINSDEVTFLEEKDDNDDIAEEKNKHNSQNGNGNDDDNDDNSSKSDNSDKEDGDNNNNNNNNDNKQLINKKQKNMKGKSSKKPTDLLPVRKREIKIAVGHLELTKEVLNTYIHKPKGKTIVFTVKSLQSDTLYEYRICYENKTGRSAYSIPSQRAKTRRAQVPDKMKAPRIVDMMPTYINLSFIHPPNGGDEIIFYIVKLESVDSNSVQMFRVLPHATEHRIESLNPGGKYKLCIMAQNQIGDGEFSNWTKIITLPKDIHEVMLQNKK